MRRVDLRHAIEEPLLARRTTGSTLEPPAIEIVYGDVEAMVELAEKQGRPVLTYSWEPRSVMMRPDRFIRVTLRDYYYCEYFGNANVSNMLASSTAATETDQCDYPVERVQKLGHFSVARDHEIAHLIRSLRLTTLSWMQTTSRNSRRKSLRQV